MKVSCNEKSEDTDDSLQRFYFGPMLLRGWNANVRWEFMLMAQAFISHSRRSL
jgi:hypothetical protein